MRIAPRNSLAPAAMLTFPRSPGKLSLYRIERA
jgi:hypothetical protein